MPESLTAGAPAAEGVVPDANGVAPDWRSGFADESLRTSKSLERYKGVEPLARGYVELESKLGSAVHLPKADDPPEAWETKLLAKLRPESPDKYEFRKPEGDAAGDWDADTETWYRGVAHKLGLPQQLAAPLLEAYNARQNELKAALLAQAEEGHTKLKEEWGEAGYAKNMGLAQKFVQRMGLAAELDRFGANASPELLRVFSEIEAATRGDTTPAGAKGASVDTKATIRAKIDAMLQDREGPYRNPRAGHKEHEAAVDELAALYKLESELP